MSPQCLNHHITHVIFDYDGVIQDTEKVYFTANDAALRAFGKSFKNIMKAEIMGRCNAVEWILQTTGLSEFGVTVEKHDMIYNQVVETLLPDAPLMPGIVNLIDYLQRENIPFAICSAANETDFERKTRKLKPFIAKFPLIELVGEDRTVKHGKPAPDPYLATIKRFTIPPKSNKNVLVIEDSINGAKSGLAAGCTTIFVPQAEFKPIDFEERIACIKPNLAEILNTLEDFEPEKYGLPQM
jgi:pseudouridine-5'-monophosphatase